MFLILAVSVLLAWFYYSYSVSTPISSDKTIINFIIEPGWGSARISHELKNAGIIRNAYVFQMYVWQKGVDSKLQDGEYFLSKNLSVKEISQILNRGTGATRETVLTLVEGWNNHDYADYLEKKGVLKKEDFFEVVQKKAGWWDNYGFLIDKPSNLDLEGYLFPDTYRIFTDSSVSQIVQKMLDNFDAKLTPELRVEIKKQGKTIHDILTLASIIEKEVPGDKDRKIVADIFYKRLKAGIALQADSTVNYATGKSTPRASAADLQIESEYNTYKYRGLPPGPIANPSLGAILAAIYPDPNPYYYFLTTPSGEVIYNVDFDGHVADKNKYY